MSQAHAKEIASSIRRNLKAIRRAEERRADLTIQGFPFDAWLIELSALYRRSRKLYYEQGGSFSPQVISSPRSLSSDSLLANVIQYTPTSEELYWSASDPVERKNPSTSLGRILELRSWCAPVFHEQTHRILWKFLPPPPDSKRKIHRYLNFCEALVVATDMALGDALGPKTSRLFYLSGATYDPGTDAAKRLKSTRNYCNYLHACVLATYLNLELLDAADIQKIVTHRHPGLGTWARRATDRCLRLDRGFVEITNITWQAKNWRKLRVMHTFSEQVRRTSKLPLKLPPLELSKDPLDDRLIYLWSEKWFQHLQIKA